MGKKQVKIIVTFDNFNEIKVNFGSPEIGIPLYRRFLRLLAEYHMVTAENKAFAGQNFVVYELKSKKFGEVGIIVTGKIMTIAIGRAENKEEFIEFLMAVCKTPLGKRERGTLKEYEIKVEAKDTEYFKFKEWKEYPTLEHYEVLRDNK